MPFGPCRIVTLGLLHKSMLWSKAPNSPSTRIAVIFTCLPPFKPSNTPAASMCEFSTIPLEMISQVSSEPGILLRLA